MKKCFICKHEKIGDSYCNRMFEENGNFIIIKEIPCLICENCGEIYFETQTMTSLEKIIDNNISELEVLKFSKDVA